MPYNDKDRLYRNGAGWWLQLYNKAHKDFEVFQVRKMETEFYPEGPVTIDDEAPNYLLSAFQQKFGVKLIIGRNIELSEKWWSCVGAAGEMDRDGVWAQACHFDLVHD